MRLGLRHQSHRMHPQLLGADSRPAITTAGPGLHGKGLTLPRESRASGSSGRAQVQAELGPQETYQEEGSGTSSWTHGDHVGQVSSACGPSSP